jgi:hypothetical protein
MDLTMKNDYRSVQMFHVGEIAPFENDIDVTQGQYVIAV